MVTAGTPLMEIGDPTDLEVVIPVLSREGAVLPAGTPVELEQWGGKVPLTARVRRVEPSAFTKVSALGVEEKRVNVIADILTPADQRPGLGDDFRVEAKIIISEATNAVTAPSGALFRRGDTWSAFLLLDGKARLKGVSVGASNGRETQILEGLKSGDDVILYPGDRVKDGQKVKALEVKK